MKLKLIGVQPMDFTLDNGYHFSGSKLHFEDLTSSVNGQIGHQVLSDKISSDSSLSKINFTVGKIYNVYFDNKGKISEITSAD